MYKYYLLLLLPLSNNTCKKENISNPDCNQPVAYIKEYTTPTSKNWEYFSEKDLTIKDMQPAVYEQTNEGLKFTQMAIVVVRDFLLLKKFALKIKYYM